MKRLRTAAGLVVTLVAARGAAMMPTGPSPEPGLQGVWRVIGAGSAPWTSPRRLTKRDAPLLEYAVEFRDREVKGPPPLACESAKYSSGVSYQDDLFGGKLANDKNGSFARAVNLTSGSPTTFRVICGTSVRDYYVDDNADLVVAEGGVVYTLQRPGGMDPEQYKAGFSGPSFDCTKARTAGEQFICKDASISKADRRLASAYHRLRQTEIAESFATVQASQRAWLNYVLKSCKAAGKMPDDLGQKNDIRSCLDENYTDRAERLDGARVVKSEALLLEPRMRFFSRAKPETEESDIYPWMSGGKSSAAFNAWISRVLELSGKKMDDKQLFAFGNDIPEDMKLYARRTYSVVRFDSKIASLQVLTYDYTGGAHEVLGETSLNWDLIKGRPISLNDVFQKERGWARFATDYCLNDLRDQFQAQGAPGPDRSAVTDVVNDGGNWMFDKDKAIVHFTVYTVASFSGGEFDVDIPYRILKPYMRADAPVLNNP